MDLELPPESIQREKSIGMWYEDSTLRVRGQLRDCYTDPDRAETVLHEYRLDLWVDRDTMIVGSARIEPLHLPYAECFRAPENIDRLVGLKVRPGFTADALARLQAEDGCTHMNSLISDLSIASLFHGYITLRAYERKHGGTTAMPPDDHRTGICAGWCAGGALATWMESGRGIAPSPIYPTTMQSRP